MNSNKNIYTHIHPHLGNNSNLILQPFQMVNAKVILYKILKIYILIILITQHFSQYECSSGKKTCFVSKAVGYIHTYIHTIHYEARPPTIVTRVIILSS